MYSQAARKTKAALSHYVWCSWRHVTPSLTPVLMSGHWQKIWMASSLGRSVMDGIGSKRVLMFHHK